MVVETRHHTAAIDAAIAHVMNSGERMIISSNDADRAKRAAESTEPDAKPNKPART